MLTNVPVPFVLLMFAGISVIAGCTPPEGGGISKLPDDVIHIISENNSLRSAQIAYSAVLVDADGQVLSSTIGCEMKSSLPIKASDTRLEYSISHSAIAESPKGVLHHADLVSTNGLLSRDCANPVELSSTYRSGLFDQPETIATGTVYPVITVILDDDRSVSIVGWESGSALDMLIDASMIHVRGFGSIALESVERSDRVYDAISNSMQSITVDSWYGDFTSWNSVFYLSISETEQLTVMIELEEFGDAVESSSIRWSRGNVIDLSYDWEPDMTYSASF